MNTTRTIKTTSSTPERFGMSIVGDGSSSLVAEVKQRHEGLWLEVNPTDNGTAARLSFVGRDDLRLMVDLDVEAVDALIEALTPLFAQRRVNWPWTWLKIRNRYHRRGE
jgi:hypothetical protein